MIINLVGKLNACIFVLSKRSNEAALKKMKIMSELDILSVEISKVCRLILAELQRGAKDRVLLDSLYDEEHRLRTSQLQIMHSK